MIIHPPPSSLVEMLGIIFLQLFFFLSQSFLAFHSLPDLCILMFGNTYFSVFSVEASFSFNLVHVSDGLPVSEACEDHGCLKLSLRN